MAVQRLFYMSLCLLFYSCPTSNVLIDFAPFANTYPPLKVTFVLLISSTPQRPTVVEKLMGYSALRADDQHCFTVSLATEVLSVLQNKSDLIPS